MEHLIKEEAGRYADAGSLVHLSAEEKAEPGQVLAGFFDVYELPEVRNVLGSVAGSQDAEVQAILGHMQKLVEAAWLLHMEELPLEEHFGEPLLPQENTVVSPWSTNIRHLPFFDGIHLDTFCQVELRKGERESVEVEGPEAALQRLTISVSQEGRLTLGAGRSLPDEANLLSAVKAIVTYSELRFISTSSGGGIRSEEPVREAEINIVQNGSASIALTIEAGLLQTVIHGSGEVSINGTCFSSHVITYGGGHFKGEALQSRTTTVFLAGTGEVRVCALKKLEGTLNGKSRLYYSGHPWFKSLSLSEEAEAVWAGD
ncbi:MAG TPA: head GIN domain-containing protein [Flavisolibacter sp.]|nr:head GIN domain-containing protein [Flavisolibacter sp.]